MDPKLGTIEQGKILFSEGKIIEVGKDIIIPKEAEIIDLENEKYILPGFIDPHTHQGLFDPTIGWAGMDGNETTDPITPHLRGIDALNPHEPSLGTVARGGVTCLNTGPGSGNVISGQTVVVKPYGKIVDNMIVKEPAGLKIALGENPKRVHGKSNNRTPSTRMGIAGLLRSAFIDAKNYIVEWDTYREKVKEAEEKGKVPPNPPKEDLKWDVLVKVLKKEIPLHAHAHRSDDIATIIRIAEEFDLEVVLIHCTEGPQIAEYIAEKNIPAIVGPTIYHSSKPENKVRQVKGFQTVADLVKAGVKVSLQTDSLTPMIYFPILPMSAIKAGLTREEALKCVTINPAEALHIEDKVGSLEPRKDADIVIWSGDPFDFYNHVDSVYIDGKLRYSNKNNQKD